MKSKELSLHEALKNVSEGYANAKPDQEGFDRFKAELAKLLNAMQSLEAEQGTKNQEFEEHYKTLISDFLKDIGYKQRYYINIKKRIDLAIYNASDSKSSLGVLFEVKSPTNAQEMITTENINAKALQELVYYYLQERITRGNLAIKHLIVTNAKEWFIFDAREFERLFGDNISLKKQFQAFEDGELSVTKTKNFYEDIAAPFIDKINDKIAFVHFNLEDYAAKLQSKDTADEDALVELYKFLSPEHLLKLPFRNDSNTLNKAFYNELLYIIGLTEVSQGGKANGKKLIERCQKAGRQSGSLLENAIDGIVADERLENIEQYGNTDNERLFHAALELAITWINRILFLKLMEAQLLSYHQGDDAYAFLTSDKIKSYDALNDLFFRVLACQPNERQEDVEKIFEKVPYLNSSLFTPTELEKKTLRISALRDDKKISIFSETVLKDGSKKKKGKVSLLEYLFAFLGAYNFGSEKGDQFQSQDKLINASVLGLIFEKINGYKDGSFFTPGFITMYMCRETIRKAIVQKFNEEMKWNCKDIREIRNEIIQNRCRQNANEIINSLKVCDPAVGSGHFLVSALNEVIALKSELDILQDRDGNLLNVRVTVEDDELAIKGENGDQFTYRYPNNNGKIQRVQETLFHEKQTIIENCLFGVDINPNSVAICRLRLWIELLKSAYYKNAAELETLPNIDINIKCGNSLVSRFPLDADLKSVLKGKCTVEQYRNAVDTYRNAKSRDEKQEMERLIAEIKSSFRGELSRESNEAVALRRLKGKLHDLTKQKRMFEKSKKEHAAWKKEVLQVTADIEKQEAENEAIKASKIYANAFEWRFEFPEVLNESDGSFAGFDLVLANPPYLNVELMTKGEKDYYRHSFTTFYKRSDAFNLFLELASTSLTLNGNGIVAFIVPSIVLNNLSYKPIREKILKSNWLSRVFYAGGKVFSEATVDTVILFINKKTVSSIELVDALDFENPKTTVVEKDFFEKFDCAISVSGDENSNKVFDKIFKSENINIEQHFEVFQGIVTGNNPVYIFDEPEQLESIDIEGDLLKPVLHGRDFNKWIIKNVARKILYLSPKIDINDFPKAGKYLAGFKQELSKRRECLNGAIPWFALQWARSKDLLDVVPKIIVQGTRNERLKTRIVATIDETSFYGSQGLNFIIPKTDEYSVYFLIGIINSTLVNYLFATKLLNLAIKGEYIKSLSFPKPSSKVVTAMEKLSKQILAIKSKAPNADTAALESEIDRLVYELYGLTEAEREIVEGQSA